MTSRYEFDLARPGDDEGLRRVLELSPMPGRISLALRREPSFFRAASIEGAFHETIVCRNRRDGEVVGLACRSMDKRFVNGSLQDLGYLSQLRLLPEHRRQGLVARGYAYLSQRHAIHGPAFYLTTVAADNQPALSTLLGERAHLPVYRDLGRYHTIVLRGGTKHFATAGRLANSIRPACHADGARIVAFLQEHGPKRQFFPHLDQADLFSASTRYIDLAPEDVLLAERHGKIVGVLGIWNQCQFKQTVVTGYHGWFRYRRLYNLWSQIIGTPSLPAIGQSILAHMVALPTAIDHDVEIIRDLVDHALAERVSSVEVLMFGIHQCDPWRSMLIARPHVKYDTRLFQVFFRMDESRLPTLDDRVPYLELGCL